MCVPDAEASLGFVLSCLDASETALVLHHKEERTNFCGMHQLYGVTFAQSCNQPAPPPAVHG